MPMMFKLMFKQNNPVLLFVATELSCKTNTVGQR